MFLLVPAYPGCPGSKAVKRSLLLFTAVDMVVDVDEHVQNYTCFVFVSCIDLFRWSIQSMQVGVPVLFL